jgi:hypothetical protein
MSPFASDGHLHDLGLELYLDGATDVAAVEAHLAVCEACQARVQAAHTVAPPLQRSEPHTAVVVPANRSLGPWVGVLVALAAAVLVYVAIPGEDEVNDGYRLKGHGVQLQVFREVPGGASDRLKSGDAVFEGDRLGFRVRSRDRGHLMVVGTDGGEPYLCYPQAGGGHSELVMPSGAPVDLQQAVRMDGKLGEERIVAIVCRDAFDLASLPADLQPAGCYTSELVLHKEAP